MPSMQGISPPSGIPRETKHVFIKGIGMWALAMLERGK